MLNCLMHRVLRSSGVESSSSSRSSKRRYDLKTISYLFVMWCTNAQGIHVDAVKLVKRL